jgi:hypothetical protein
MKTLRPQIVGSISCLLAFAGLARAAELTDPLTRVLTNLEDRCELDQLPSGGCTYPCQYSPPTVAASDEERR